MSQQKRSAFILLISVFFFWGFVASSNTILIPVFKQFFNLKQWQSQLVDSAFFIAYTFGALIYFIISVSKGDPLNKIGYKNGLILGLCISAVGTLGFIPAASMQSFPLMLGSLFVVALGFALQQIVANPYVIAMGHPSSGAHRVSLAGGINSFGTTIGPLLISYAIFGNIGGTTSNIDLNSVTVPYLILGAAFLTFAGLLFVSKLPPVTNNETLEKDLGALKYPQVILGMLAIFVYVGVEVSVQSNLPELMKQSDFLGLESSQTVHFISLYWGCLMIGRWVGAINVFNVTKKIKTLLMIAVPLLAYGLIIVVNQIKGSPINDLLAFLPFVLFAIAIFFVVQDKPATTMIVFGSLSVLALLAGLILHGQLAIYCFISVGLFCSVMWPCVFSLAIAGLGKYTNQASSLLIMMIAGGAIMPPLQGFLSDKIGIHTSYVLPLIGFAYLAYFGYKVKSVLQKQGINYETTTAQAH